MENDYKKKCPRESIVLVLKFKNGIVNDYIHTFKRGAVIK